MEQSIPTIDGIKNEMKMPPHETNVLQAFFIRLCTIGNAKQQNSFTDRNHDTPLNEN